LLREPPRWSALSLPTMSIGQEVSVTALQMVAAFSAVANGGTLMQPRLVRAIFDADGRELRRFDPVAVRQVISKETAQTLTRILVRVVAEGTGRHAAIAGYDVGGKTGTAQKLDPQTRRYSRAPGVLSFVGFVPADAPRLAMLVMLDEPKNEKWGSEAAAPVFAAIGRDVLRYLEVQPRDTMAVQIEATSGESAEARQGRVRLVSTTAPEPVDGVVRMPDLRARTKRQVLTVLAPLRVVVEMVGRGLVVQQEPAAGTPLDPGTIVRLTLDSPAAAATLMAERRPPKAPVERQRSRASSPGFAGAVEPEPPPSHDR
jgi:cell division protein FtsI (penicillin-binding protein 3)